MNESHVKQVAELEKICFSDPWSENSVASELNNPLSVWLVAEENGIVCGYVGSQTVLDETDMMNIAVHPDFRRKGIAAALIAERVRLLKERGSRILRLRYWFRFLGRRQYGWYGYHCSHCQQVP